MMHNPYADAISVIMNAERAGKKECVVRIKSKLLMATLDILKNKGYIDDYEVVSESEGGKIKVKLNGSINEIKALSPRFYLNKDQYDLWEKKYLPAVNTGLLIISTSEGVKTHKDVKGRIGGTLVAYVY